MSIVNVLIINGLLVVMFLVCIWAIYITTVKRIKMINQQSKRIVELGGMLTSTDDENAYLRKNYHEQQTRANSLMGCIERMPNIMVVINAQDYIYLKELGITVALKTDCPEIVHHALTGINHTDVKGY